MKANAKGYFKKVVEIFEERKNQDLEKFETENLGHGRYESRVIKVIREEDIPYGFNRPPEGGAHYTDLQTVGMIVSTRELKASGPFVFINGVRTAVTNPIRYQTQVRYFVPNMTASSEELLAFTRIHWQIENNLHWSLDVNLNEDQNKIRNQTAAQNLAVARKIALNLVKQDTSSRIGLKSKLKKAGWDLEYLESILFKSKIP